ncbi:uncharacterized protein F54H12.2-like [Pecten maximus]|uniref:uncharacterized protein F54H12.2-like n=1 Tax=Pecten maximus TaxID=6579 RepID=UPI001458E853|nr:uncharacterized protein F54H12.2-like [Pecten maximus]
MKAAHQCNRNLFDRYYLNQAGGGGSGNVFRGTRMQRGHDIGGLFRGLFKTIKPLLHSGMKSITPIVKKGVRLVGKQAIDSGMKLTSDLLKGENIKAKESQLTSGMWYKDTAAQMDTAGNDNHGYIKRKLSTATSRSVEMMGRLHSDLFAQERYLVNNVNMKITLTRSKDVFCLMGEDKEFKVVIKDIYLNVRKVRLSPSVRLAHAKALEISPAKYPIRRIAMKVFSVPRGNHNFVKDNLFLGQMPKRLVIGCVDSDAYSGLITKNPFHFKDFDINFVVLNVDGKQVPTKPLQPNFTQKHYVRSYMGLFNTTGKTFRDEGNNISKDEYGTGFTLFGFDLTPDLSEVGTFHLIKKGNLSLEVHFGTALPNTINFVVYAEFDNIIEIDRNRQILFD